ISFCGYRKTLLTLSVWTVERNLRAPIASHNCGDGISSHSKKVTTLLLYSALQEIDIGLSVF
ncbi:MAG TPA: hypothetical protein VEO53_09270, partial [Candidatus Binatia bacterium]|nr:hypothetical protein [Candidatus Binatia bacterium]